VNFTRKQNPSNGTMRKPAQFVTNSARHAVC
jgi:hypothetical protein